MKTWIVLVKHQCSQAECIGDELEELVLEVDAKSLDQAGSHATGAIRDAYYHTDVDAVVQVVGITPMPKYTAISQEWPEVRINRRIKK